MGPLSKVALQQHLFNPNQPSTRCLRPLAFLVSLQPIPRPRVTMTGSAEQLVTHNADVTDRMIEKRNLADLSKRFSHSGSPAPRDRLRAAPHRHRIFTCDAAVCEKPVRTVTL
jgi:hypothetical protein